MPKTTSFRNGPFWLEKQTASRAVVTNADLFCDVSVMAYRLNSV